MEIPREDYEQFESQEGQEKPSPTIEVLQWVVGTRPDIAIADVIEKLRNIERMDVIEEINNAVGKCKKQPTPS